MFLPTHNGISPQQHSHCSISPHLHREGGTVHTTLTIIMLFMYSPVLSRLSLCSLSLALLLMVNTPSDPPAVPTHRVGREPINVYVPMVTIVYRLNSIPHGSLYAFCKQTLSLHLRSLQAYYFTLLFTSDKNAFEW